MSKERKPRAVIEDRVSVAASPEVVWTCFADLGKWPVWFPALVDAEWVAGTPWMLGARLRQTARFGFPLGKAVTVATIVEVSASPYVAWAGKTADMESVHGFRFDATANGTEVLSRHEFYGPLAVLSRFLFLPRCVHRAYRAGLEGLKAYVETGSIQLKMTV